jgi:HEAT repeat protein
MQPRLPFAPRSAPRGASAALLGLALAAAAAAAAQPPALGSAPPDKKDPDKKEPTKPPEYKWPTEINGKDLAAVMKELEDPDPSIRLDAARVLPGFGPAAHKDTKLAKLLIKRMRAQVETDPGVRSAVFAAVGMIQFEHADDLKEALRLLAEIVDTNLPSSMTRMNAIQALALFGPKGEPAVTKLTGVAMTDPAFETRRSIAAALGQVGYSELGGPNLRALTALATLTRDPSAAVRMAALQSLLRLGPPWDGVKKAAKDPTPPVDAKAAGDILKLIKARVGDSKAKPPVHGLEKDKHVEIWARLVLIQFDPRELNDDNLDALAQHLSGAAPDVKAQALHALGVLGEAAGAKVKDVVRVMEDKDAPYPLTLASIQTLGHMGAGAKPALPSLKKLLDDKKKPLADKMQEIKKQEAAKAPLDPQLVGEAIALDGLVRTLEAVIKHVEEAKPMSPAATSTDPPKKP